MTYINKIRAFFMKKEGDKDVLDRKKVFLSFVIAIGLGVCEMEIEVFI